MDTLKALVPKLTKGTYVQMFFASFIVFLFGLLLMGYQGDALWQKFAFYTSISATTLFILMFADTVVNK